MTRPSLAAAFAAGAALLAAVTSCSTFDPPPPPPQTVVVRVNSDPGRPLAGAEVRFSGKTVGVTGANGAAEIKLAGRDGEVFGVTVACPAGFESPQKPVKVTLHRLSDANKHPEYAVTCPPKTRTVVVAVRAGREDGKYGVPNIPVTLLGREVAKTDAAGAAHVVLTLEPGEQFDLQLDTSDERFENLRPQNPMKSFGIGQRDDIFPFDQNFDRKKTRVRYTGPKKPRGPKRIP
jgi:hypothetical protein